MAIVIPTSVQGIDLVNWDSDDGFVGDDLITCMTDGDTTTLCAQIGRSPNECAKFIVPGLKNAVAGDTITITWTARMQFPSMAIMPYGAAEGVTTGNEFVQAANPANSPATITLNADWIADLFDRGSGSAAFRIVEFNSSPVAGNISITEVQVNLGPDDVTTPLMWGRAF